MFQSLPRLLAPVLVAVALLFPPTACRAEGPAKPIVNVILWFDTEDYLLPASDAAGLKLAEFLTAQDVRATFKVVGEKARRLEQRGRKDVIAALKKHEIGYHSNWHSVQPSPALYLSNLGWDEGVAEFDRREGPGRRDVERIFGAAPSCYGQPGSSWGPQSYGTMRRWGMNVYLDSGRHVDLDGLPCYYAGVLNLYHLAHTMRADLNDTRALDGATERFANARKQILAEGGGLVSIYYHPCEWVHKEFWDGVNFARGANPPASEWKAPRAKTAEETRESFRIFADYVAFLKRFSDVRFITASEAARLYADGARRRTFSPPELKEIARRVQAEGVGFQKYEGYALSAAEVLLLLNDYLAGTMEGGEKAQEAVSFTDPPVGPTGRVVLLSEPVVTDASQFGRTARDVADFLHRQGRVPSAVWLGSTPVPPDAYLRSLADVVVEVLEGRKIPERVTVRAAKMTAMKYVSDDDPKLWGWVIFPPGFRAPNLMALARQQAWSLKPALLTGELKR